MHEPLDLRIASAAEAPPKQAEPRPLRVRRGTCYLQYIYDVAHGINLDACQRLLKDSNRPVRFRHRYHAPYHFQFSPEPIRVVRESLPRQIGPWITRATVELVIYDFGAVSVMYALPLSGAIESIIQMSGILCGSEALMADAEHQVHELLSVIRPATAKPGLAKVVEDYLIFEFEEFDAPIDVEALRTVYAHEVARLLRSENDPLSDQEVADSMARWASFGRGDVTIIDWNAALICDQEAGDVRAVLEFANVQLLELRFLDRLLDDDLDRAYDLLSVRSWWRDLSVRHGGLSRVGHAQVESAILFEQVNNALKLLGDQYLARVYRLASERLRLQEWNAGILRKLNALESIYAKLHDRASNQRIEVLEWIVIILIAIEILLPFVLPGRS